MTIVVLVLDSLLPSAGPGRSGALARIAIAGGLGALCYLGLSLALRVEALDFFVRSLVTRVRARPAE
jgi:hypothetical protein